jgi:acetate kinase
MGLTALDGLVMGQRCGAIDPGVLLYLIEERGLTVTEVSELLHERSGLLGVSGISHDMRTLLASDAPHAAQAVELFVYHAARAAGSLAVALGGLDALVFTGGIGEHSAPVRAAIGRRLEWLGIELDVVANENSGPRISTPGSRAAAWVIPTNEELVIARHTRRVLELGTR